MADLGPDEILILICVGSARAAKQITLDQNGIPVSSGYNAGKQFKPYYRPASNADDLAEVLDSLAPLPRCFVIRGSLRDDVSVGDGPNATVERRSTGPTAAFEPAARRWLAIDLDAIPAPAGTDPINDPDDAIEYLVGLLPPEFWDARCWWQWTASQGFKADTLNARLWFWLDRPVSDKDLRQWANHVNAKAGYRLIDPALFNPVQPHYTAGPIFVGMTDPLPRRTGRRSGLVDEVALVLAPAADEAQQRQTEGTGHYRDHGGVEAYLARMGDGDGLAGFRQPITSAVASAVRHNGPDLDRDGLKARIRAAIEAAPVRVDRSPANLTRYASDAYLDPLIDWAVNQERQRRGTADPPPASAPTYPLPTTDVADVRAMVEATVEHMVAETLAYWVFYEDYLVAKALREAGEPVPGGNLRGLWPGAPPEIAIRADCGVGKSKLTRDLISRIIEARPGGKVIIATPTVALADKAAAEARAIGLRAVVIRGRNQPVPEWKPQHDKDEAPRMCGDLDAVQDCVDAGLGVQTSVCVHTIGVVKSKCSLFDTCLYQAQNSEAEQADIIFMAHQYLFLPKPEFINAVSLVIIDESFWQAGLEGTGKLRITLSCAGLETTRFIQDEDGQVDNEATNDWNTYASRLARALRDNGEGWLIRAAVEAADIDDEIAVAAGRLVWRLRLKAGIVPAMDPAERRRRSELVAENNKFVRKAAAAWKAIGEMFAADRAATGNIWCGGIDRDQDGGDIVGGRLLYRKDIHADWRVSTLILDATMPLELVGPYFPWVAVHDTPAVVMPHVTVRQVVGAPVSGHKLIDGKDRRAKDNTTAINNQTAIHRFARLKARGKDRVLLAAQQQIETRLVGMGLPDGVQTTHHNAAAGIDIWKDIDQLQTYGRTLPGPREVEYLAAALTGQAVPLSGSGSWYPRESGGITMADGTSRPMIMDRHGHPVAEAVRWAFCEGQLIQIIGRARGVNRTPADPCEIVLVTDVVLPIAVHEVVPWQAPDRFDEMALRGAVLENAADMARAYPDLWESHEAARKAEEWDKRL